MRAWLWFLLLTGCGGAPAASAADRCAGDRPIPKIHGISPPAGGAGAWFELGSSHVEPTPADNQVLLDGKEVTIVRIAGGAGEEHAMDATAGQLTPRQAGATSRSSGGPSSARIGVRIPAGTPSGSHALGFRACQKAAEDTIAYEVLPSAAPVITSLRVVRGATWSTLYVTGQHLAAAEELVLVAPDGKSLTLGNVTRVDDGQLHVAVEKSGTFEVFVKSPNGLGGGPPSGVVTVR